MLSKYPKFRCMLYRIICSDDNTGIVSNWGLLTICPIFGFHNGVNAMITDHVSYLSGCLYIAWRRLLWWPSCLFWDFYLPKCWVQRCNMYCLLATLIRIDSKSHWCTEQIFLIFITRSGGRVHSWFIWNMLH